MLIVWLFVSGLWYFGMVMIVTHGEKAMGNDIA
jgi:hypothetical protein